MVKDLDNRYPHIPHTNVSFHPDYKDNLYAIKIVQTLKRSYKGIGLTSIK